MKKLIIFLLALTGCMTENYLPQPYNQNYLKPIDSKKFVDRAFNTFIFIEKTQSVLVARKDTQNTSGIYKLTNPQVEKDSSVIYKLKGSGNLENGYLGLKIIEEKGITKISVVVQLNYLAAKNSLASFGTPIEASSTSSSVLEILSFIGPWVRTSASGIFLPDRSETWTFDIVPLGQEILGSYNGNMAQQTDVNIAPVKFPIKTETNISATSAIFSYIDTIDGTQKLVGVSLDTTYERTRANFIIKLVPNIEAIASTTLILSRELENSFHWNFGTVYEIVTPNGILNELDAIPWIKIPSANQRVYSPQNLEKWSIDAAEEVIFVTIAGIGTITTYTYILERSDVDPKIYRLLALNPLKPGPYHNKYFSFIITTAAQDIRIITDSNINNVVTALENKTGPLFGAAQTLAEFSFAFDEFSIQSHNVNFNAGINKGRSSLSVFPQNNKIWILGGYSTPKKLFSTAPNYDAGKTTLPETEQEIYSLNNLSAGITDITVIKESDSFMTGDPFFDASVQQSQIASTSSDNFYVLGAGAANNERLYINTLSINRFESRVLNSGPIVNRFNGSFYGFNERLYFAGGSTTAGFISEIANTGTYQNNILESANGVSWTEFATAPWKARTLAKVFVVDTNLVLVGGYVLNGGTSTPVNDVWLSTDGGKTWSEQRSTDTIGNELLDSPPLAISDVDGQIPGVAYGGIIFMMNPNSRNIHYSSDLGKTWTLAGQAGSAGVDNLYGAALTAHNNYLYIIGGQKIPIASTTDLLMEKNIYRIPINFQ